MVAALLPLQAALGIVSERLADRSLAGTLMAAHVQLGIVLLALVVIRVVRRLWARGDLAPGLRRWRRFAVRAVHMAMYAILLALPASGYLIHVWSGHAVMALGVFELPALFTPPTEDESGRALAWYIHVCGAWLLGALVLLHVAAAWKTWRSEQKAVHASSGRRVSEP